MNKSGAAGQPSAGDYWAYIFRFVNDINHNIVTYSPCCGLELRQVKRRVKSNYGRFPFP